MKGQRFLSGFYGLGAVLILWQILSLALGASLVPPPVNALRELARLTVSGTLPRHGAASLLRLLAGLCSSLVVGVPLGILAGASRRGGALLSPVVYILYPVPKIAFLPVFMVLFGLGNLSKAILLFSVVLFQVIIAARDGVREIPQELHLAARALEMSRQARFFRLYLPSVLPRLFSSMRISVGIGMAVLFFAENYATSWGLGYFVMNAWVMIDYPMMFAGIIALSVEAAALLLLIDVLQRLLCPWINKS